MPIIRTLNSNVNASIEGNIMILRLKSARLLDTKREMALDCLKSELDLIDF